jgi:hypothetical protein
LAVLPSNRPLPSKSAKRIFLSIHFTHGT